jgi:hypothetical protein
MSCRETHGNSATTSLAKFITGAEEKTVSQVFHKVRRDAADRLGESAHKNADFPLVDQFLQDSLLQAQTDERIRESRRESLISRFESARVDAANGKLPSNATFAAWKELIPGIAENSPELFSSDNNDETIGVTEDGITISLGDVQAAKRRAEAAANNIFAQKMVRSAVVNGRRLDNNGYQDAEALKERADRLQAAYDSTDAGYKVLLASEDANPKRFGHQEWLERKNVAEANRSNPTLITLTRQAAQALGEENAEKTRNAALDKARIADASFKENPTPQTRVALDAATQEFQQAQRIWLYSLAESGDVFSHVEQADLRTPVLWGSIGENVRHADRSQSWRVIELLAADKDKAEVRVGRINDIEAARRATARAEARQTILDSEGLGEIDPVNRRFAESMRLRRKTRAGVV